MKAKMPKSARKFIRREKARIRREFLDVKTQGEAIQKLYEKLGIKTASVDSSVAKPF